MMETCDVCGDPIPTPNGFDTRFDDHNLKNYVRHVFLSHPSDEDRIRILQAYVDMIERQANRD